MGIRHNKWRGAVEPSVYPRRPLNANARWRGAVDMIGSLGNIITSGPRGGHAVESHIGGFAGFNIQRPKDRPAPAKKP